jgi:DNA-binding MarR family transcriptional regulator
MARPKKTKPARPKPAKRRMSKLEQLSPDDRQALVHVGTKPGCALKAICVAAGCSHGAGKGTVKKLIDMGLVRRDDQKRPYRHYCTTAGYKLRERVCDEA